MAVMIPDGPEQKQQDPLQALRKVGQCLTRLFIVRGDAANNEADDLVNLLEYFHDG